MPSARYHVTVTRSRAASSSPAVRLEFGHAAAAYGTERILPTFERFDPYTGQWVRGALPFAAYGLGLAVLFRAAVRGHRRGRPGRPAPPRVGRRLRPARRRVAGRRAHAHPRLGITMLASANRPVAYAIGGYATRLTPRPRTATRRARPVTGTAARRPGGARRHRAADAAYADAWAPHVPGLQSVIQYHVDADAVGRADGAPVAPRRRLRLAPRAPRQRRRTQRPTT